MTYHTDEFLRKRQNDPKWHDAYLQRMSEHQQQRRNRREFWIGFCVIFLGGWWIADYFFGMALFTQLIAIITSLFH